VIPYRKFSDTLKNSDCALTPPNPPKASKVEATDRTAASPLGGLGALDATPLKVENAVHGTTHPRVPFSARAIGDEFKDEGSVSGEHGSDMPLDDTAIIAPGEWMERIALPASSEPGFSEPWPPRRGRIEWQGNTLLHFCSVCGAWGSYGFGVNLRTGRMGQWFCAAHRPQGRTAP
jgi:hypothetical protein